MIRLHDSLSPDVWGGTNIKPDVREHLLKIAQDFITTLKIHEEPDDITITGSIANYNYTGSSDIDLHVLYDLGAVTCDEEITKDYVLAKKSLWNDKHDITIHGRPVEVYVQDVDEPHISTGVYSLKNDQWLNEPVREAREVDEQLLAKKLQEYIDIIEHNLSKDTNHNYLKKIRARISEMRKEGLARGGQYSVENLVFKELRNRGYLDKLAGFETAAYDRSVSIESFAKFAGRRLKK